MKINYLIRKGHRYLGIIIGIQFVLWTISGLFFAWTNITEIRGEHLRIDKPEIKAESGLVSPSRILESVSEETSGARLESFRMFQTLGDAKYEAVYELRGGEKKTYIFDAANGERSGPVTKSEAKELAGNSLKDKSEVRSVEYLTAEKVGGHHEYRDKRLPAWAVSFVHPEGLTVYVSAETGEIQSFRTSNWRIFDFLWMLHTMDFLTRDDINNWALRTFSGLGVLMLVSGYLYFFITARFPRPKA